jgi:acetyl esterase/lipase
MHKNKISTVSTCLALATFIIATSRVFAADVAPPPVLLWPSGAPRATGDSEEDKPAIHPYLPDKDKNTGCAVIVCPGGAFTHRAADYEGTLIAQWFKARGIAAFILRYRLAPLYSRNDAVADGHRAVQYLRAHADEYRLAPDRIGMIGFSAGSELACMAAFRAQPGQPEAADLVARQPSRLNFMILGYGSSAGVVSRTNTPPTFMFCTHEDRGHATGMINLYREMYQAGVPVEVHFFPNGEHGVGLAQGDAVLGTWPDLMFNWMRANNFLTGATRAAVSGHVKLDGQPLPHGSITFLPVGQIGVAPVTAYIMNSATTTADFKLARDAGPVPGKYRVEIRQDAVHWVSNARDPFRRSPLAERAAAIRAPGWAAPTIEDGRLFKKARPADASDLTVEIKPGDNQLEIEVFSK